MAGGFTLFEVLLSLLILGGALTGIMSGFFAAERLEGQSRFEETAAFYAERELELLKTDLLAGRRDPARGASNGRFRLPGGWKSRLVWAVNRDEPTVRVVSRVSKGGETLALDSFLFVPSAEGKTK